MGYGWSPGRLSEKTGEFWPITLAGYFVQMLAVPALALAENWQVAPALIILERIGKAIRNPPRDVMLSHAAKQMGYGWGFGVHEALDQRYRLVDQVFCWSGGHIRPSRFLPPPPAELRTGKKH